jgi:hypothetical protein
MKLLVVIAAIVVVIMLLKRSRVPSGNYRGAIGFKNRHATEIALARVNGFTKPIEVRTLTRGEHSFNYPGPQPIPAEVTVTWRFVGDAVDRVANVSLISVPPDATEGEIFFVLTDAGEWTVEYAPQLQIEELQRGEGN